MVKVKICGVRTLEGARAVVEAGADFVGLNFVPASRRFLADGPLRAEVRSVLRAVSTVGVFVDAPVTDIERIVDALALDAVQLHGGEGPEVCVQLASRTRVIKALRVDAGFDPAQLDVYRPHVAYFLFDGPRPGHGEAFDWTRLARAAASEVPFFVAGGLSPENVSEAISALAPFGVDTASGIEVNGAVDPSRVGEFVERARRR